MSKILNVRPSFLRNIQLLMFALEHKIRLCRYGLYYINSSDPVENRILTAFGATYKGIVADNGFVTDHLVDLLSITSAASEVTMPMEKSFTKMEPSAIPSQAGVAIWNVRLHMFVVIVMLKVL